MHRRRSSLGRILTAIALGAVAVLTQAASAAERDLLQEIADFQRETNDERLHAVQRLLRAHGLPVEVEAFRDDAAPAATGNNVLSGVGSGRRQIVLGAHYDAKALRGGGLAPGAVDNAAAIVALVRAATRLRDVPLRHRVVLAFFDREETGLVGSRRFSERRTAADIAAAINVDIAGYGDTLFHPERQRDADRDLARTLHQTCAGTGQVCVGFPQYPETDDLSFEAAGWPNISLSMLPRAEVYQLWLYETARETSGLAKEFRPPLFAFMHSRNDTIDRVDPGAVQRFSDFVVAYVRKLDSTLP